MDAPRIFRSLDVIARLDVLPNASIARFQVAEVVAGSESRCRRHLIADVGMLNALDSAILRYGLAWFVGLHCFSHVYYVPDRLTPKRSQRPSRAVTLCLSAVIEPATKRRDSPGGRKENCRATRPSGGRPVESGPPFGSPASPRRAPRRGCGRRRWRRRDEA